MLKAFLGFLKFLFTIFIVLVIFLAGIVVGSVLEQANTRAKIVQSLTMCEYELQTQQSISDYWKSLAEGGSAIAQMLNKKYQACEATCTPKEKADAPKKDEAPS